MSLQRCDVVCVIVVRVFTLCRDRGTHYYDVSLSIVILVVTTLCCYCDTYRLQRCVVASGSVICDADEPIKVTSHFVARVVVFNINFPLTQGYPLVFHLKSYNEPCVLKKLISLVNKATGEGIRGRDCFSFCRFRRFRVSR